MRTTSVHVAVGPLKYSAAVVEAPWATTIVWVTTVVFRRCPTSFREHGVDFSSLICPVHASKRAVTIRPAHIFKSLLIVVITVIA